jgi:hypothetical protein
MTATQRLTAHQIIQDKGQAVTLYRLAAGAYNPATGTASQTESEQAARAVFFPANPYRKVVGQTIVTGDQQMILSALNADGAVLTAPHVDDVVEDANARKWSILAVDPLTPAGLDIMFDCVVRRAA